MLGKGADQVQLQMPILQGLAGQTNAVVFAPSPNIMAIRNERGFTQIWGRCPAA